MNHFSCISVAGRLAVRRRSLLSPLALPFSLVLAAAALPALAQPEISWYTIDCGGGTSTGGSFSLTGTIAQFDAGGTLTGATLELCGGFWPGVPILCPSDFDSSGFVDTDDFTAFVLAFEEGVDAADFDESGFVDTDDFTAFVLAFEAGC